MVEKLKEWYKKPFVQVAVKSAVVAVVESVVSPWGYTVVQKEHETQNKITPITEG